MNGDPTKWGMLWDVQGCGDGTFFCRVRIEVQTGHMGNTLDRAHG